MARSRASAKKAGTAFETEVCNYLKEKTGFSIIRMPKTGAADKGDIYGVKFKGNDIAVECKSPGEKSKWSLAGWWGETVVEIENFEAYSGVLMVKKFRKPLSESYCIFNTEEAKRFGINTDDIEITRVKGSTKWRELIVEDKIFKFPMVGYDDFWIVTTLEKFSTLIDRKTESLIIELTLGDIEDIKKNATHLAYTVSGEPIVINILNQ